MSAAIRTIARAAAVLATAALLVPSLAAPDAAARDRGNRADSVLIHIDSVSPSTPLPTNDLKPLVVTLTLTNTTSADITNLTVVGERGTPIGNQEALDATIAAGSAPSTPGIPIKPTHPVTVELLPHDGTVTTTFETTTGIPVDTAGICLCAEASVYPLYFSAHNTVDGIDQLLGVASTFMPAFYKKPQPVRVSWVWPLLEPPHRFLDDTVFTDDTLAESVSTGRLSRALAVVEQVGPEIPMTLLIDPELLDELEVMATESYTVQNSDGKTTTPGTGQTAASAWLDRLSSVLVDDPEVSVELTPYADPDVETLTEHDRSWSSIMPAAMTTRVTQALAGRPLDSTLAWPDTGAISKPTLRHLVGQGVTTLLLNSAAVRAPVPQGSVAPLLLRLDAKRQVAAALLSPAIQKDAAKAISASGDGLAAIPSLVAELAVRAAQEPDLEHSVTIAAPRYVDPDVTVAVRTILETSRSTFAKPIALSDATADSTLLPPLSGQLAKVPAATTANLPAPMVAAISAADDQRLIRSLLDTKNDADAAALVAALPSAIQRAESSAWRDPVNIDAAANYADLLDGEFDRLDNGVQFVQPSSNSYTLTSNTSPLPITVSNALPYAVRVRIRIVPQTPGFETGRIPRASVEANSTKTVRVPATTERSGLFRISVLLQAPNGRPVGEANIMQVRSTALGFIGVIIMIVAGSVLGIALLWRIVRRVRSRRKAGGPPADPVPVPTPETVS